MSLRTAVAFFIFNRPEPTRKVFARIREARPRRLFIAADGPRSPAEAPRCLETRAVVEAIDWDCRVERNYADTNLGCALRESSAVDWVFSLAEEAIFLEDDTLPDPTFFAFADELLERYRHDTRVFHIGGVNFQPAGWRCPYSYCFSRYMHGWGWATWRRAWAHYDFGMAAWPELKGQGLLERVVADPVERAFWEELFDQSHTAPTSYDYQWLFAVWAQHGLSILPAVNLVTNIGFGPEATHTRSRGPDADRPVQAIGRLSHPPFVVPDTEADRFTFDRILGGEYRRHHRFRRELLRRLPPKVRSSAGRAWLTLKALGRRPSSG